MLKFTTLFQEESNGVNGKGESGDDDDDEGVSSSDEEEENVGAVDEAFRAEVQAALGPAMVDVDKEVCYDRIARKNAVLIVCKQSLFM